MRIQRDPNAEGNHQFIVVEVERAIDRAHQRIRQRCRIVRAFPLSQQNKLITADTCQGELALQEMQQALRYGNQQLVTDIMAVSVIDGFKAVKIHEHQGKMGSLAIGFADGLIESVFQQDTVGQTRQGIVQGQLCEFPVSFCKGRGQKGGTRLKAGVQH